MGKGLAIANAVAQTMEKAMAAKDPKPKKGAGQPGSEGQADQSDKLGKNSQKAGKKYPKPDDGNFREVNENDGDEDDTAPAVGPKQPVMVGARRKVKGAY